MTKKKNDHSKLILAGIGAAGLYLYYRKRANEEARRKAKQLADKMEQQVKGQGSVSAGMASPVESTLQNVLQDAEDILFGWVS